MKRSMGPIATLAAALALMVAVNFISSVSLKGFAGDWTEEKLYTLSDGTRSILGRLDSGVRLKLFYSRTAVDGMPAIRQYADRVIALLDQYAQEAEPYPENKQVRRQIIPGLQ